MKQYDILIIGGGVVGAAIARELSRYHLDIALLEKEAELAFGVSKSNSGIIHPGTHMSPHSLKGKLCVMGNRLTRTIAKELGVDFKEVGELILAFRNEDVATLENLRREAHALGVPKVRIVTKSWILKKEPNISRDVIAALYAPTAGIISPYRWVYDLAENAIMNGVDVFTNSCVRSIRVHHDKVARHEQSIFDVSVGSDIFTAKYVINAAGLYADNIARMVGITDFTITPRKGEEYLLDKRLSSLSRHLLFPLPTDNSKGILVIRTSDGNPMVGPTATDCASKDDLSTTDEGRAYVFSNVKKLIPSIEEKDIIAYFSGLRPASGDDFIIRRELRIPGMITVAGIQSPGLTAAPAIALMVSDLLRHEGVSLVRKRQFERYRKRSMHLFSIPFQKTQELIKEDPEYGDIVCRCEMVSVKEIRDAIRRGARTLDGIKFRTRAQAGRCHGGFCTTRIMKILAEETGQTMPEITKRGAGSEIVKRDRCSCAEG
jgi:glycerol-3-phosphate dehydrogenase